MDCLKRGGTPPCLWAVAAVTLAESSQFMVSSAQTGAPLCIYVGFAAQVALLLIAWARPCALMRYAAGKGFALMWASLFGLSVLALSQPLPLPVLCLVATVFKACEMLAVLTAAGIVFSFVPARRITAVALAGIVLAFAVAVVFYALPGSAALTLQVVTAVSCAIVPAAVARQVTPFPPPAPVRLAAKGAAKARTPLALIVTICFFAAAIQFIYMSLWAQCSWSSAFSMAVLLSLALLAVEFKTHGFSRFSLLDLTCASLIAAPVIFVGSGFGAGETSVAMASIGFYLFLPRVLQVSASTSAGTDANPLPVFAQAELADWSANVAVTACMASGMVATLDPGTLLVASTVIAFGCIFSVFALYDARTKNALLDFIEDEPSPASETPTIGASDPQPAFTPRQSCHAAALAYSLTAKEEQVLALIASGSTLTAACEALGVSMSTVKSHVYHIYQKLDVHSRGELAERLAGTCPTASSDQETTCSFNPVEKEG